MAAGGWLFPSYNPIEPVATRQPDRAIHAAAEEAKIDKRVSMHTLRHSFATHLLEQKLDIRVIQAYLSRYTHRVATSNQRLIAPNQQGVTFRYKDYRAKGRTHHKTMTLGQDEFMRRFLLHVLPSGFHRIRHYGLLANSGRKDNLEKARELLLVTTSDSVANGKIAPDEPAQPTFTCPDCGAAMVIVSVFTRETLIRAPPWQRCAA